MEKGEIDLRVGNGARVAALTVGDFSLFLPSGLVLELNNCYFVPTITKNLVSVSSLHSEGFEIDIKNGSISILRNGIFYACIPMVNELFVLDLKSESYNINTKKAKIKLFE